MNIIVCGDSHSEVFQVCNLHQSLFKFDVCTVGGATAQGAVNPNSKTDALKIFTQKINNSNSSKLIIVLGEVDCGFVIWVRAKRYNISIDEQIECCINNLFTFVKNILIENSNYKNEDIIISGAILPTIRDSTDKKYLNGARSEVNISQIERTLKTLEYNNLLKDNCDKNGYKYIEITNYIIDDYGIVKNEYLNKNDNDHHLDFNKTYNLWIAQLNTVI
jgi:hypothetical protein